MRPTAAARRWICSNATAIASGTSTSRTASRRSPRARGDLRLAVLEVDVPDAIAVAFEQIQRRAAAVGRMAGVETQADERGIRGLHQRIDLLRRLDEGRAVMMEH